MTYCKSCGKAMRHQDAVIDDDGRAFCSWECDSQYEHERETQKSSWDSPHRDYDFHEDGYLGGV